MYVTVYINVKSPLLYFHPVEEKPCNTAHCKTVDVFLAPPGVRCPQDRKGAFCTYADQKG